MSEAQARMTSVEFTEWLAFQRIEPGHSEMQKFLLAQMTAAVVNAVHATIPMPRGKSRPKPRQPADFYPRIGK